MLSKKLTKEDIIMKATTPVETPKKKKFIGWYLCAGILLLAVAGFFAYQKGMEIFLRQQLENVWQPEIFSVESISFNPWKSAVSFRNLTWKNPRPYSLGNAITVEEVYADLNAPALLRHVIHFENVEVRNATLNFEFRKAPTRLMDLLSMLNSGPGINVWDALVPKRQETETKPAADNIPAPAPEKPVTAETLAVKTDTAEIASQSGVWYFRIDRLEITGTKTTFAPIRNLEQMISLAIEALTANLVPAEYQQPEFIKFAGNMLAKWLSPKIQDFLKEQRLPDYCIEGLGQNDRSTLNDICEEAVQKHLAEIKQYFQTRKDAYIDALKKKYGPKIEWLKKWFGKTKKDKAAVPETAELPEPGTAQ